MSCRSLSINAEVGSAAVFSSEDIILVSETVVFCDANPEKADATTSVRAQYVDFIISAMNGIDFCKAKKKHANCQGF